MNRTFVHVATIWLRKNFWVQTLNAFKTLFRTSFHRLILWWNFRRILIANQGRLVAVVDNVFDGRRMDYNRVADLHNITHRPQNSFARRDNNWPLRVSESSRRCIWHDHRLFGERRKVLSDYVVLNWLILFFIVTEPKTRKSRVHLLLILNVSKSLLIVRSHWRSKSLAHVDFSRRKTQNCGDTLSFRLGLIKVTHLSQLCFEDLIFLVEILN